MSHRSHLAEVGLSFRIFQFLSAKMEFFTRAPGLGNFLAELECHILFDAGEARRLFVRFDDPE